MAVRPRKGAAALCSRCHQPAPGYDQLAERRFEFTPLSGFFVFVLYTMRRVDCQHCAVVVEEIDLGVTRLLWVGKERTIESFQRFFTTMGEGIISKIVFICSDMWEPYLKVIHENCFDALHILDRFHIVAKMNKALDKVRPGETRRMKREGSRWLLLKRCENPGGEQRLRPGDLLRDNLKAVRAYLLKEAFPQLWD